MSDPLARECGVWIMADELRTALELATDEELQTLTEILFRRQLNPLDYFYAPDPIDVQSQRHQDWIDTLEDRFRFLAADGLTVLKGGAKQITYRQTLIQVCRHLKLAYRQYFSTLDLESEIYLTLLQKAWNQLPKAEQERIMASVQRSLVQSGHASQIPLPATQDAKSLFLTSSGALAMNTLIAPTLVRLLNTLALKTAGRGVAVGAVARYGAMRTALAFLGPTLWTMFFVDLGWRSISTNYGRIIPTIFALAQIRLTRAVALELAC